MSETDVQGHPLLRIDTGTDAGKATLHALGSDSRLRILELLSDRLLNVSDIAVRLDIPLSTVTQHVRILEEAGLVRTELKPGERGRQKVCQRVYDTVVVQLPSRNGPPSEKVVEASMPIGAYVDCRVAPTCGLADKSGIIGYTDDPGSFFEPARMNAQLLWFQHGWVEYRFPNRVPEGSRAEVLWFTMELCSEAPMHHPDWPSDITLSVNDKELCTWTSPGDFGGRRGIQTPQWWDTRNSQYGLLKEWRIDGEGVFLDGERVSALTLDELRLQEQEWLSLRIAVKEDARNRGGLNLFGRGFGNYPQDIVMRLRFA